MKPYAGSTLRVVLLAVLLLLPSVASAAFSIGGGSGPQGSFFGISFGSGSGAGAFGYGCAASAAVCNVANTVLFIINSVLVPVLFAIAFIVFLWGVFKAYIWSQGSEDSVSQGHKLILWGLVAFAVMISIWGLVNVVASTFGLAGYRAPPLPQSY